METISLVMEETEVSVDHGDAVVVTRVHHILVVGWAGRRPDVLHATQVGAVNIVSEWEEGVRAQGHALQLADPLIPLSLEATNHTLS